MAMTMAELSMRHEEEMRRMIEECVFDLISKMPRAHNAYEVETMGLTIDEMYELSNKFLPKLVLARYIAKAYHVVSANKTELVNFEVDEKGRPCQNGEKRTIKSTRIVYACMIYEYFGEGEEEEELFEEED